MARRTTVPRERCECSLSELPLLVGLADLACDGELFDICRDAALVSWSLGPWPPGAPDRVSRW